MAILPISQQITFFYVQDLVRTAQFYEKILGLHLEIDQGGCRIYRVTDNGWVGFCQRESPKPQGVIFTLVTPEVDGWYVYLLKHGVAIEAPPKVNEAYRIYHFFLHDPDGYLIEIQRFL